MRDRILGLCLAVIAVVTSICMSGCSINDVEMVKKMQSFQDVMVAKQESTISFSINKDKLQRSIDEILGDEYADEGTVKSIVDVLSGISDNKYYITSVINRYDKKAYAKIEYGSDKDSKKEVTTVYIDDKNMVIKYKPLLDLVMQIASNVCELTDEELAEMKNELDTIKSAETSSYICIEGDYTEVFSKSIISDTYECVIRAIKRLIKSDSKINSKKIGSTYSFELKSDPEVAQEIADSLNGWNKDGTLRLIYNDIEKTLSKYDTSGVNDTEVLDKYVDSNEYEDITAVEIEQVLNIIGSISIYVTDGTEVNDKDSAVKGIVEYNICDSDSFGMKCVSVLSELNVNDAGANIIVPDGKQVIGMQEFMSITSESGDEVIDAVESNKVRGNGTIYLDEYEQKIFKETRCIPIRVTCEAVGNDVNWDEKRGLAYVSYKTKNGISIVDDYGIRQVFIGGKVYADIDEIKEISYGYSIEVIGDSILVKIAK